MSLAINAFIVATAIAATSPAAAAVITYSFVGESSGSSTAYDRLTGETFQTTNGTPLLDLVFDTSRMTFIRFDDVDYTTFSADNWYGGPSFLDVRLSLPGEPVDLNFTATTTTYRLEEGPDDWTNFDAWGEPTNVSGSAPAVVNEYYQNGALKRSASYNLTARTSITGYATPSDQSGTRFPDYYSLNFVVFGLDGDYKIEEWDEFGQLSSSIWRDLSVDWIFQSPTRQVVGIEEYPDPVPAPAGAAFFGLGLISLLTRLRRGRRAAG